MHGLQVLTLEKTTTKHYSYYAIYMCHFLLPELLIHG